MPLTPAYTSSPRLESEASYSFIKRQMIPHNWLAAESVAHVSISLDLTLIARCCHLFRDSIDGGPDDPI